MAVQASAPSRPPVLDGAPHTQIRLERVTMVYGAGHAEQVRALDQVSLSIAAGEFVAITGPSGSGKTTMMNLIACLDLPTEGRYLLDGVDVSTYSKRQLARLRGRTVGCVFQSFNLIPRTTAALNVELPLVYASMGNRAARVRLALEQVGLADRARHMPSQLSGGQQQRVAIARALVTDPTILLADEPTGALDTVTGEEILSLLTELHRTGRTVVLITHEKDVAGRADRIIQLYDGHLVSD
jgi:putative ABC transport system ATP-binding protein